MRIHVTGRGLAALVASVMLVVPIARANDGVDLTTLSLEELMDIEVSSAAKREQPLGEATAAIYIIMITAFALLFKWYTDRIRARYA